jgi:hypothetical protein
MGWIGLWLHLGVQNNFRNNINIVIWTLQAEELRTL